MDKVTRRSFVTIMGVAGVVPAAALLSPAVQAAEPPPKPTYLFFNAVEVLFIEAACERLIPSGRVRARSCSAPGSPISRPAIGRRIWLQGDRLYRSGPWTAGTPTQGYQLAFTPAELFHVSLRAIHRDLDARGTPFTDMSGDGTRIPISNPWKPVRTISMGCPQPSSSGCCCR